MVDFMVRVAGCAWIAAPVAGVVESPSQARTGSPGDACTGSRPAPPPTWQEIAGRWNR